MITEDKKLAVKDAINDLVIFMTERNIAFTAARHPGLEPETYSVDGGRKYIRIVANYSGSSRHVHCFVDAQTGSVYKAAGWKTPALNGERFNLLDPNSFAELKAVWDPYGSYLYKR